MEIILKDISKKERLMEKENMLNKMLHFKDNLRIISLMEKESKQVKIISFKELFQWVKRSMVS